MNVKKHFPILLAIVLSVLFCYLFYDNYYSIANKAEYFYVKHLQPDLKQHLVDNNYKKGANYSFVKINKNTTISNLNDAQNAIYTFLDSGWEKYTIKCNPDYLNCTDDVKKMVENNTYLTDISNFVHPYNTFEKINSSFTSTGRITFKKEIRYTDSQIKSINEKVNQIYNENYDANKDTKGNIKIFHDYIISHTKYDSANTSGTSDMSSSNSYGVLFDGLGICSGYTDAMTLFLEKMGLGNIRVSSDTHVWNLVFIDNIWYHLDLTWDDPIMSDGSNTISYKYFLITDSTLKSLGDNEHNYDANIYIEAK